MRKILALVSLAIVSCNGKDDAAPLYTYEGKWFLVQTISKQYTLETDGDTLFTRNETVDHTGSQDYIDFQIDDSQQGHALLYRDSKLDSMYYEMVTPSFFRLDSTLCEVTALADSSFRFKTLVYDHEAIPGKIQVTQDFVTLSR